MPCGQGDKNSWALCVQAALSVLYPRAKLTHLFEIAFLLIDIAMREDGEQVAKD